MQNILFILNGVNQIQKWNGSFFLDLQSGNHSVRVLSEVKQEKKHLNISFLRIIYFSELFFCFPIKWSLFNVLNKQNEEKWEMLVFQFDEMQCNPINLPRYAVPFMYHICMWTVN